LNHKEHKDHEEIYLVRGSHPGKEGDRLTVEPVPPKSLLAILAGLSPLDEAFPPIEDPVVL
jgi:hypothetical protein